jgi:phosphotriesterase-related protein
MEIQTVTGLVPVEQITLADAHDHVWIKPPLGVAPEAQYPLDDYEAIEGELRAFRAAGATTIVDCMPGGAGRDAAMLVRLSQATGLHIAAVTGFHVQKYYPPNHWLWSASAQRATAFFIEELTIGMREVSGSVPATVIKIGYTGVIEGQSRVLMEAAAEAARWTGAAVLFHTEKGAGADVGLHRELAQAGVLLGYDTFARPRYDPENNVWPLLREMVRDGFSENIAIGLDLAQSSMWRYNGGPGMMVLVEEIIPRLLKEGIDEKTISNLTAQNIARRLVRRPPLLSMRSAHER